MNLINYFKYYWICIIRCDVEKSERIWMQLHWTVPIILALSFITLSKIICTKSFSYIKSLFLGKYFPKNTNICNVSVKFLHYFPFSFHHQVLKEKARELAVLDEVSSELFLIYSYWMFNILMCKMILVLILDLTHINEYTIVPYIVFYGIIKTKHQSSCLFRLRVSIREGVIR